MNFFKLGAISVRAVLFAALFSLSASSAAASASVNKRVLAISVDNDLFVPFGSSDRDFTGGMALTYSGGQAEGGWEYLDAFLENLDQTTGIGPTDARVTVPSIEVGFYGFTPSDIEREDVVRSDRPYASLAYLSVSRMYQLSRDKSVSTSLSMGVLGSDIVGDTQNELHRVLGNDRAQGWHNQVSDGGELTARYQFAYHDYWDSDASSSRFKTTYFASAGYLTEVGVALSTRQGLISSPDHRFNPELVSYGERVNEMAATPSQGDESFFWAGITVKARLYNAFLQGQFKDSAHTLDHDDLRPLIAEAWVGYTVTLGDSYKASYVIRAQTSEIRDGEGDRGHLWGGLVLSRVI